MPVASVFEFLVNDDDAKGEQIKVDLHSYDKPNLKKSHFDSNCGTSIKLIIVGSLKVTKSFLLETGKALKTLFTAIESFNKNYEIGFHTKVVYKFYLI